MNNDDEVIALDRGMPSVNERKGGSKGMLVFLGLCVVVMALIGTATWYTMTRMKTAFKGQVAAKPDELTTVKSRKFDDAQEPVAATLPPPVPAPAAPAEVRVPAIVGGTGSSAPIGVAGAPRGELTSIPVKAGPSPYDTAFVVNGGVQPGAVAAGAAGAPGFKPGEVVASAFGSSSNPARGDGGKPALGGMLTSTYTPTIKAGRLADPSLTVSEGTTAECILRTRIVAEQPGLVVCRLSTAIYSANGKVVLADRGSLVTGEQSGQMKQGQKRLYVLWRRIETPEHVTIKIDAPAADSLGGSGIDGDVDNHWPQRIGAALMLSIVSDIFAYQTAKDSGGSGGQANQGGYSMQGTQQSGQSIAEKVLESTINIPPTLTRNQGDKIMIMIPRDLDFSSVYDIQTR